MPLRSFIKRVLSSSNSRDVNNLPTTEEDPIKQQHEDNDDNKHDEDNDTSMTSAVGHAASNMLSSRNSFVSLPLLTPSHSTPVKSSLYSKVPRLSLSPNTSIKRPSTSSGVVTASSGFFQRSSRLSMSPSPVANGRHNSESRRSINLLQEDTTGMETPSLSCCSKEVAEDPFARVCPSPTIKQKHSRPFTASAAVAAGNTSLLPYSPSRSASSSVNRKHTSNTSSSSPASHVDGERVKQGRIARPSTAPALSMKTNFGNETNPCFPSEKIVINPLFSSTTEIAAIVPSRAPASASLPMAIPTISTLSNTVNGSKMSTIQMSPVVERSSPISPTQTQLSSPSYLSSSFSSSYTTCSDASSAATTTTFSDTATTIDTIITSTEGGSRGKKNALIRARANASVVDLPWFLASPPGLALTASPAPTSTDADSLTSKPLVRDNSSSIQITKDNEESQVMKQIDTVPSSIPQEDKTEKRPSLADLAGILSLSNSPCSEQEIKVVPAGGTKTTSPVASDSGFPSLARKRSDAIFPGEMTFNRIAHTAPSTTTIFTTPSFLDFDSPVRKSTYRISSTYARRTDQAGGEEEKQVNDEMIEEIPDYIVMKGFEAQERYTSTTSSSAGSADAITRQIRPAHSLSRFIEDFQMNPSSSTKDEHSDEEHVFRPLSGLPAHPTCKRSFTAPAFVFSSSSRTEKSLPSIPFAATPSSGVTSGITSGTLNTISFGPLSSGNSECAIKSNNHDSNTRDDSSSPFFPSNKIFPSLFDMGDVQVPAEEDGHEAIHELCRQEEEYEEFFERTAFPLPKMSWWPEPPLDNESLSSSFAQQQKQKQKGKEGSRKADKAIIGLKQSFSNGTTRRGEEKSKLQREKKKLSIGYPMLLPLRRSSSSPITITSSST